MFLEINFIKNEKISKFQFKSKICSFFIFIVLKLSESMKQYVIIIWSTFQVSSIITFEVLITKIDLVNMFTAKFYRFYSRFEKL